MKRSHRATLAQQTLEVLERRRYSSRTGVEVDLADALERCLAATRLYTDRELQSLVAELSVTAQGRATLVEVTGETSLAATRRLVEQGLDTMCLNFASAKNAGGGFLGGAEAQEESLARASALYASLISQRGYYDSNRACRSAFYTEHLIHSPSVPIFRDDSGELLDRPYLAGFITSPAVNAGVVRSREQERIPEIADVMRKRVTRVLSVAVQAGHRGLVLGAWGCGVFQNDPQLIAQLFAEALEGRFENCFEHVVFAVFDRSPGQDCLSAFQERFRSAGSSIRSQ